MSLQLHCCVNCTHVYVSVLETAQLACYLTQFVTATTANLGSTVVSFVPCCWLFFVVMQ